METLRPFYLFHSQNNSTESRGTGLEGDPNRALQGPLISVTGERERIPLRHLNRLRKGGCIAGNSFCNILYINNIETIPDLRGARRGPP
jgi:hypothetical protein